MKYQALTKFGSLVILLLITVIGSLVWFSGRDGLSQGKTRNVLLISIDTCRADYLSCYGYHRKTTPNIDALADEAILFTNVVSPVPLTLPAHGSILTGTIPPYHGVRYNFDYRLGNSNVTLAEILRENGFATGAVIGAFVMDSQFGLDQGFNTYNDRFSKGQKEVFFPSNERRAEEVTHFANIWLEKHRDENFFLFLHYFDPHADYIPPEPFALKFADSLYAGEIAYTDHCIGKVIGKLKELGLYDSTLIIITSDHGEMLGEHGEESHGYFIYQSAIKVPLLFKLAGQSKPKNVKDLAGLIDIVPTVCSLLGIEPPPDVQGKDLSGYFLKKQPSGPERHLYCECLTSTIVYNVNTLMGVVTDRWKYIQTTRPELYDLTKDPQESNNMVTKEHHRARILQDRLMEILKKSTRQDNPDSKLELTDEDRKLLESLGYVAGGGVDENFDFDQSKEDPKDLINFHRLYAKVPRLISQERYAEAKSHCEKMLIERPKSLKARFYLAKIAIKQSNFTAAIPHLTEAIRIKPDFWEPYFYMGMIMFHREQFDKAIGYFHGMLQSRSKMNNKDKKVIDYKNKRVMLRSADSAAVVVYDKLGIMLLAQGKLDEAIDNFRQSLEIHPFFATAHMNLGKALLQKGQLQEAITHLREAVQLDQDLGEAHNHLAQALLQQGKTDEAIRFGERASKLTKYQNATVLKTLAAAYAASGSFGEAIETAERALKLALASNQQQLADEIKNHLELYRRGQAYHDSAQSQKKHNP